MILDFLTNVLRSIGLLPPQLSDASIYCSKPESARAIGWALLSPGRWVTIAPLVDVTTPEGLTASLPVPGDAERALRMYNARLPTSSEIDELRGKSLVLKPVLLPSPEMRPPRAPGESDRGYAIRCYAPMNTLGWARIHNMRGKRQLATWDRATPLFNFGKHPYRNGPNAPPPGRCYLEGWYMGGGYIQNGVPDGTPGPHIDGQFDYGTTTIGIFEGATPPPFDATARDRFMSQIPENA